MAIRKLKRNNKETGKAEKTQSWFIAFRDHHNREQRFSAGRDLDTARKLEIKLKELVGCRKANFYPQDVQEWIDTLPQAFRDKLAGWDLLSGARVAAGCPLSKHLAEWKSGLVAGGVTVKQAELLHTRAGRVFDEAGFIYWADVQASKVSVVIAGLAKQKLSTDKKTGKRAIVKTENNVSSMTKKHFMRAAKQFSRWMLTDGRATSDPLATLTVKNAVVESHRRALSKEEIVYLLDYTGRAGFVANLSGQDRALIYRLAIETGLRASEIASLTRLSFDFDGLFVQVEAKHTKNKKKAKLPIKAATMELIKAHLKTKTFTAAAFPLKINHTARMIKIDLAAARKIWVDEVKETNPAEYLRRSGSDFLKAKTDKGKVDFHSLRHTFGTLLAGAGVHPKTAMDLMRHSKIELTMSVYTHSQDEKLTDAIEGLPDFTPETLSEKSKNGTD